MDCGLPGSSVHGIHQARINISKSPGFIWSIRGSLWPWGWRMGDSDTWSIEFFSHLFLYARRLCDTMNCSLPGSSVHGIFQARIREWVAISFSRGSSRPRDQNRVSCIVCRFFTIRVTRKPTKRTNFYQKQAFNSERAICCMSSQK